MELLFCENEMFGVLHGIEQSLPRINKTYDWSCQIFDNKTNPNSCSNNHRDVFDLYHGQILVPTNRRKTISVDYLAKVYS